MSDPDLDAEFERIVSRWAEEAPDPQRRPSPDAASDTDDVTSRSTDPVDPSVSDDAATPAADIAATDQAPTGIPARDAVHHDQPDDQPDELDQLDQTGNQPVDETGDRASRRGRDAGPANLPPAAGSTLGLPIAPSTSHAWRGAEPPHEDVDAILESVGDDETRDPTDEHFVPPTEFDLPSAETDPMFWAIVGGLAGGPLLLLYVLFFDRDGSGWWIVTAVTMVVVGFVLLVLRGGTERDPFDDGTRI